MATGDTLLVIQPIAASFATVVSGAAYWDIRNSHIVLSFATPSDRTAIFSGLTLPRSYAGSGLMVQIAWAATASTSPSQTCRWGGNIERLDTGTDIDNDSFAATQSTASTAPTIVGGVAYATLLFSPGANMDSLNAGEGFRFRVFRDADGTSGTDTMMGEAQMIAVEIREG